MRSSCKTLLSLSALLVVALAAGCGGGGGGGTTSANPDADVPADAVALVGETPVLRTQLDGFLAQAKAAYKAQGREFPPTGTPEYEQLKNLAVDRLVERVEFAKEAAGLGITVTDEQVTQRLDEFKVQFYKGEDGQVDEAKYQEELKSNSITEEAVRANITAQLINEALFKEVTKDATVTDEDIRKYYDQNPDRFTKAESREVAHILVETKEEADKLYKQLKDGADFAKLAKDNSLDPGSAADGGKLTDEKGTGFASEFEGVAFELQTGEISKPVETQFGWHIIKALEDAKPEVVTPFDDAKDSIRAQLLQEHQNALMNDWVTATRAKNAGLIRYAVGFGPPPSTSTSTDTTSTTS